MNNKLRKSARKTIRAGCKSILVKPTTAAAVQFATACNNVNILYRSSDLVFIHSPFGSKSKIKAKK